MAPSERVLVDKLKATALAIFNSSERDQLSVKRVRDKLEAQLGLEKGFFVQPTWKEKSKVIVKEYATQLIEGEELKEASIQVDSPVKEPILSHKKSATPNNKRAKKPTSAEQSRPAKRQKKQETPEESSELSDVVSDEDSPESEFGDSDVSDAPKPKKKSTSKPPVKRQPKKKAVDSEDEEDEEEDDLSEVPIDDEDDSDAKPKPKKATKPAARSKGRRKKVETPELEEESELKADSESEDELASAKKAKSRAKSAAGSEEDEPASMKKSKPEIKPTPESDAESNVPTPKKKAKSVTPAKAIDSESEMSIVLDEAPKPKAKRGPKAPKETKVKAAKANSNLSPAEEQIKTLQTQLVRCGVRKIWQFELKQFEDDTSAKVRYLQQMLRDIGMTGRFSEARAKEIKEMRELQADLEAVKEGEKVWGMESGRPSRSKAAKKSLKINSGEDEDEDENGKSESGSEDDSDEQPRPRVARAKQDLAFLGDEEDSDE
ncbi:hypothetical protein LHYA1_G005000 [Lachnellula hyalina]|uniref:Transcriptional regulator n=1 Tax=Lachnellula hyalina TaxID=1316788 RepID=A0A8H8QY15_9HELO|nr:uncharacterized protein LHYA1_G005000 [Lachnellula hyalina]TVY24824.1 hypothetical protein LHYA1_G005000 [Lachnellula hyalina]